MHGWLALALLLSAPRPSPSDSIPARLVAVAPAESLAVTRLGSGPPIVLVPGLLGSAFGFRHLTGPLVDAGYEVVVIEPLGTGASSRPSNVDYSFTAQAARVAAVMDAERLGGTVLVAHAASAPLAYRLAAGRPDLVYALVTINGAPLERLESASVGTALRLAPLLRLFGVQGRARKKVEEGLRESSADDAWVTDGVVAQYTAGYRDDLMGVLRMLRTMSESRDTEPLVPDVLARVRAPVRLLVGGGRPGVMKPAEIETLRTHVAGLRVDTVDAAGQYIHEERPADVVAAILDAARAGGLHVRARARAPVGN
jgi:pimeloyl-ACP methyl ester carboxylesterase